MKVQHIRKTHKKTLKNSKKPRSIASILFSYFVKSVFCGVLLFVFGIFAAPYVFDENPEVSVYEIATKKRLYFPVKVAVISDLHGVNFGNQQDTLLSLVKNEEPDFIVLTGDIMGDNGSDAASMTLLEGLQADGYPLYYVSGNAEYRSKRIEEIKRNIEALGITVLDGRSVLYSRVRGEFVDRILISGIDDPENPVENTTFQLKRAWSEIEELDDYKILLAHRPELVEEYLKFPYDLIISGHAHGGQWRIPGILERGFYAPDQGFFPKYTHGLIAHGEALHVISRGLSGKLTVNVPRVFNRPELVILNIREE